MCAFQNSIGATMIQSFKGPSMKELELQRPVCCRGFPQQAMAGSLNFVKVLHFVVVPVGQVRCDLGGAQRAAAASHGARAVCPGPTRLSGSTPRARM